MKRLEPDGFINQEQVLVGKTISSVAMFQGVVVLAFTDRTYTAIWADIAFGGDEAEIDFQRPDERMLYAIGILTDEEYSNWCQELKEEKQSFRRAQWEVLNKEFGPKEKDKNK